ncbi:hypothetical protein D3C80_1841790 [compost metagenome]
MQTGLAEQDDIGQLLDSSPFQPLDRASREDKGSTIEKVDNNPFGRNIETNG